MKDDTGGNRASRPRVPRLAWTRRVAALAAMAGIALLVAACGSSTSSDPTASTTTAYQKALAFSQCMRTHGVPNFPYPTTNGNGSIGFAFQGKGKGDQPGKEQLNSSQSQAAEKDCRHLLPNGGVISPAQRQQALNRALRFSQCMRTHGLPNFPDPQVGPNGGISLSIGGGGLNPQSSQFQSAQRACQSLMPGPKGGPGTQTTGGGA